MITMGQNKESRIRYPYKSPTPDQISIMATGINSGNDKEVIPTEVFNGLYECNFNAAHLNGNIDDAYKKDVMVESLGNSKGEGYQINIIATCYFFNLLTAIDVNTDLQRAKDFFDFFVNLRLYENRKGETVLNNANAIYGWALRDEPTYSQLEDTADGYNLKTIYDYIQFHDYKGRPVQINLVGGECKFTEGHTYEAYLNLFQQNFNSTIWTYDLYPITQESCLINNTCSLTDNCKIKVDHKGFYNDFSIFHERSKATGGVFWAYVQSMEYINVNLLHPAALESYIRFEAFSALAFGAQGIVYWTYKQQPNSSEVYPSALVDRNGNKMPAWYFAKQVNHEILQYSKVFVNSELIGWAHTGESYGGPSIGSGSFGAILSIKTSGIGALVTQLKTNDHNYMVIVSHDVEEYQTVDLTFVPTVIYELTPLTSYGEHGKETQLKNRTIKRELIPGGYLIYEFKDGAS